MGFFEIILLILLILSEQSMRKKIVAALLVIPSVTRDLTSNDALEKLGSSSLRSE